MRCISEVTERRSVRGGDLQEGMGQESAGGANAVHSGELHCTVVIAIPPAALARSARINRNKLHDGVDSSPLK